MPLHNKNLTLKVDEIPSQEISNPALLSKYPMVSVHMITYNHEPYICQAIEGVIMQETNFPIELIIGEDCSFDHTREIILNYQKKHPDIIRVITSDSNVGAKENSLRTVKVCCGKYIALCEGDDYWIDQFKLQKQVDFMEANPGFGLVHTECDILTDKTNKLSRNFHMKKKRRIPTGRVYNEIMLHNFIVTATVVASRELVIEAINELSLINKKNWIMGDRPIWMYISLKSKIGYINQSTTVRRVLEESAQHSKDLIKRVAFIKSSYSIRFYFIEKYGCASNIKYQLYKDYNEKFLYDSYRIGDEKQAKISLEYLLHNYRYGIGNKIELLIYYLGSKNVLMRYFSKALLLCAKVTIKPFLSMTDIN